MTDQKYKYEVSQHILRLKAGGYAILTGLCFGLSVAIIIKGVNDHLFLVIMGVVTLLISFKLLIRFKQAMNEYDASFKNHQKQS